MHFCVDVANVFIVVDIFVEIVVLRELRWNVAEVVCT
jgi:hypothetical protein